MRLSRRSFLSRLGIGAGAALISPALLAQAMHPEPATTPAAPAPEVPRPQRRRPVTIRKSQGIVCFNGTPVMEIYDFDLRAKDLIIDISSKEEGYREYIPAPKSFKAVTRGRLVQDLPDGTRLIDALIRREIVTVKVVLHDVHTSFDAMVTSTEFTYPPDFLHVLVEMDVSGAITVQP